MSKPDNLNKIRELTAKLTNVETDLSFFFKLVPVLFCIADVKGTFTEVNPAWTKLFGWTAEELTTHPWTYFVHPDDLLETIEVSKIPAGTLLDGFVNRYRTKDGDYIKNPLVCISLD